MFAIQRGNEYLGIDGGFVSICDYKLIKWFGLYISASQILMKLDGKGQVASAVEVLEGILQSVSGLAPELLEFAVTHDTGILKDIRDLAVLRGGIVEAKQQIEEQHRYIEALERDKKNLLLEASKLKTVMEDYEQAVKMIS